MPKKTSTPCREQSIEKSCKDVCHQMYQEETKIVAPPCCRMLANHFQSPPPPPNTSEDETMSHSVLSLSGWVRGPGLVDTVSAFGSTLLAGLIIRVPDALNVQFSAPLAGCAAHLLLSGLLLASAVALLEVLQVVTGRLGGHTSVESWAEVVVFVEMREAIFG